MLALREMIEKSLLLRDSFFSTSPPNSDAVPKSHLATNSLPKTLTERCNQADLGYFVSQINKTYGEGEIIWIGKNVYYKNVVIFVQRL